MFKSGMTDLAPHQHLLFSARFPIQKGKIAGVCHQLAGGGGRIWELRMFYRASEPLASGAPLDLLVPTPFSSFSFLVPSQICTIFFSFGVEI